jgi:hypothetical protein
MGSSSDANRGETRPGAESAVSQRPLPDLLRRHVERSLPDGPVPRQVRIMQEGHMWQKPGGRAMRFTARQFFAVDRVAFSWQARFPVVGPVAIKVVDEYAAADGRLEVRLLGLPVQRQHGPETVVGEALRYLAELPWVPYALAHNRELEWRELDERSVEVAAHVGAARLVVTVEFDAAGDVVRTSSRMRPRKSGKTWVRTPWGGDFGEYRVLGGLRVPTAGEAYWDLPEGRYVYWRGTVTSLEPLAHPFQRSVAR